MDHDDVVFTPNSSQVPGTTKQIMRQVGEDFHELCNKSMGLNERI
jgi:hypothetical protein